MVQFRSVWFSGGVEIRLKFRLDEGTCRDLIPDFRFTVLTRPNEFDGLAHLTTNAGPIDTIKGKGSVLINCRKEKKKFSVEDLSYQIAGSSAHTFPTGANRSPPLFNCTGVNSPGCLLSVDGSVPSWTLARMVNHLGKPSSVHLTEFRTPSPHHQQPTLSQGSDALDHAATEAGLILTVLSPYYVNSKFSESLLDSVTPLSSIGNSSKTPSFFDKIKSALLTNLLDDHNGTNSTTAFEDGLGSTTVVSRKVPNTSENPKTSEDGFGLDFLPKLVRDILGDKDSPVTSTGETSANKDDFGVTTPSFPEKGSSTEIISPNTSEDDTSIDPEEGSSKITNDPEDGLSTSPSGISEEDSDSTTSTDESVSTTNDPDNGKEDKGAGGRLTGSEPRSASYRQSYRFKHTSDVFYTSQPPKQYNFTTLEQYNVFTYEQYNVTTYEQYNFTTYEQYNATTYEQYNATTYEQYNVTTYEHYNVTTYEHYNITTYEHYNVTSFKHYHVTTYEQYNVTSFKHYHVTTYEQYNATTYEHYNITTYEHYNVTTYEQYNVTTFKHYHVTTYKQYNVTSFKHYHVTTF
uniref:Uncharacterized protein n=1 Tax=Timema douglasi TaxID=61478 RepID=A0A7R8ZC26_TIMDO|nr:unnamed protein product [Timema douglasi]